jgi:p-aminobenzoyl-glutamate transporter AbgT
VVFGVCWTLLLLVFYVLGWPIGPGVGMRLPG